MPTNTVPVMTKAEIAAAIRSIRSSSMWGVRTDWKLESDLKMGLEALVGHVVAKVEIDARDIGGGGGFFSRPNPVVVITTTEGERVEILVRTPVEGHVMINPKYKPQE